MKKHDYVERLNEQRLNVLKACEGLTDEECSKPMGEGKWSVKDTLGHLAAWEGEVVRAFEQKARGERPTIGDIADFDAWNKVEAAKRKDRSADEIRKELHDGRTRLLTIVNGLPEEGDLWAPERSTAKMLSMLLEHDEHHWQQIHDYRSRVERTAATR
jgi:uncharacterized damage-inducible protein DinB